MIHFVDTYEKDKATGMTSLEYVILMILICIP